MLQSLVTFFDAFRQHFRVVDAVDIVLISIVIYSALIWFRETASRRLIIGVSLLAIVYLLSRTFDMYLTSMLFHGFFAVVLVALVVVFAEDIRRLFERLANWGTLADLRSTDSSPLPVDTLVETAFSMASRRIGALMVLEGSEPLDRHSEGGISLGGRVSQPLLYSIFDPHSAGHDGAAVIVRDRVEKFGAHLPISKNRKEIGGKGTRHSAAVGLSECSDALVIVVSEERGVVSVAEEGKLREMSTAADLKRRIERFALRVAPPAGQPMWKRLLTRHAELKVLSVVLACLAWFFFAYNPETVQRTITVPIEYSNIPSGMTLSQFKPNNADVTLSGSKTAFQMLDTNTLVITVDLSNAKSGTVPIEIGDRNLNLTSKLSIDRIEPRSVLLLLEPTEKRSTTE